MEIKSHCLIYFWNHMNKLGVVDSDLLKEPSQIVAIPTIDSKQWMGKLKNRGFLKGGYRTPSHQVGFKTKSWSSMTTG